MRCDKNQAGRSLAAIDSRVRTIGAKAGVNETHRPRSSQATINPSPIEPRLGQNVLFEELRRHRLNPPANRPLAPPDFGQTRRIAILEWAVADQRRVQGQGSGFSTDIIPHSDPSPEPLNPGHYTDIHPHAAVFDFTGNVGCTSDWLV